jgi:hypothetical protein
MWCRTHQTIGGATGPRWRAHLVEVAPPPSPCQYKEEAAPPLIPSPWLSPLFLSLPHVWFRNIRTYIRDLRSPPYAHLHVVGSLVQIFLLPLLHWSRAQGTSSTPDACNCGYAVGCSTPSLVCLHDLEVGVVVQLYQQGSFECNTFRSSRVWAPNPSVILHLYSTDLGYIVLVCRKYFIFYCEPYTNNIFYRMACPIARCDILLSFQTRWD